MSSSPAALMRGYVRAADAVSGWAGQIAAWSIAASCALSAGVAVLRYVFNVGSNSWLEAQWYLFALAVMLGAPVLLKLNEHVRVDILYGARSPRTKAWIDLFGLVCFLLPLCWVMTRVSIPFVHESWLQHELSPSAGGLLRWPVKAVLPLGFVLLGLQTLAEIFRRIGFLTGGEALETSYERPLQ